MSKNSKRLISRRLKERKGSYVTEAAVSLPVLILCVCALSSVVRIAAVCEGICFVTAREAGKIGLEAYDKNINVSLCKRIEGEVLSEEKSLTDFKVTSFRYPYSSGGIEDLTAIEAEAKFKVVNAVGIDGRIEFKERLLFRAFTGATREEEPLGGREFRERGKAKEAVVFPKYGIRFHRKSCRYVKKYEKEGSYRLVMDKRDAELKGYTPCKACGGAA